MQNTIRSFGNRQALLLAAAVLLPWLQLTGQTIPNPSFEADTFTVAPGYASGNGGIITGWTFTGNAGINPANGSPFANNGAIPAGSKVAFLQAGGTGPASLSTTATGLTIGTKYTVSMRVNARTQTTQNYPYLVFSTTGSGPTVTTEVSRVSAAVDATAYRTVAFEFTATATSHGITISNTRTSGDHTLLIDDVSITASNGAWAFAPWTGDADSGIDPQYAYTHAISLGSNPGVTINGVPFIGRETGTTGRFALNDLPNAFTNRTPNNVTGNSANLAKDFRYGNTATGITLQNLKPSTSYVFTLYGIGFDASNAATPYRASTFSSSLGGGKFTVNLNHYGQGNGMRVTYNYTTDALGTPVTISYPLNSLNAGSFHTSGFSNREAAASTPPVKWTTVAWNDDASSGVDSGYVYTHAFNFGSATNVNINGVNFTGIAAVNPSGTNYTSENVSMFNNDINAVSGYGAAMAKDFVYGSFPEVHNLTGLTPGKNYVFTIYSVGFGAPGGRIEAVVGGTGEGATLLDQHQYGDNNGIRLEYRYTADATGTLKVTSSSYSGADTMHCYGLSNREADPMAGVAPSITLQPVGAVLGKGATYVLRVGAAGSSTLTYQWKHGVTDIPGETNPTLSFSSIDFPDAGNYTVTITNGVSSVTSNPATLSVRDNVAGIFNTGVGVDGQPLAAGATDPHYTLLVNPDNPTSSASLVQSGLPGSWLPNSATSTWIGPRFVSSAAAGLSSDAGEGPGNYVYRTKIDLTGFDTSTVEISGNWASDNTAIALRVNGVATGNVYTTGVTFGAYQPFTINTTNAPGLIAGVNTVDFVINNADAAVGFTGLRIDGFHAVGVIPPGTVPHIAVQPVGTSGIHNGIVKLAVAAHGSYPLGYEWFLGNQPISGETDSILYLAINDPAVAGSYKVRVSNGSGFVDSDVVQVTVGNANPSPGSDPVSTDEDVPLVFDSLNLLTNDTDVDGDIVSFTAVGATSTAGGTVSENAGIITYTPPPNFNGLDSFTYTVNDGIWGGTAQGTILVTVNPVADPPPGQLTLVLGGGTVSGSFTGTPGASYTFQRSINLGAWTDIQTVTAPPSGIVPVSDPAPPVGNAFYRIAYTP